MKQLENAVRDGACLLNLKAADLPAIFQNAVSQLVGQGRLPAEHRDDIIAALLEREGSMSTAIGHAVAVPHAYLDVLAAPVVVFIQLARPLNMGAPDGIPTRFLIILLGPTGAAVEHLDALTNIARLMSDDEFRYEAGEVRTQQELLEAFKRFHVRSDPIPEIDAEETIPESLRYSGRLFGGLINDLRRRLPHYASDFRDGLHPKVLASTLFLFFACLTPAVTFGGILGVATDGYIGAVEMIAASAM